MDADLAGIILRCLVIAMDEHPGNHPAVMEIVVAAARVYDPEMTREKAIEAVDQVLDGWHIN